MTMAIHYYRGWHYVDQGPNAPVTGRWRAQRHGVGMCANNEALLKRMIDTRVNEEIEERRKREEQ
jgi:hypothetical protein